MINKLSKTFRLSGNPGDYILATKRNQRPFTSRGTIIIIPHSLQSATRAEADGADIELIVSALIHDLGDDLAPLNHSQLAAAIIRPYVRAEVAWIIEHHGVFQMYYYGDAMSVDKNARDIYRDHVWFGSCERFCRDWDQLAFDPDYPTKPLAHFEPMLREIFTRPPFDPAIINPAG